MSGDLRVTSNPPRDASTTELLQWLVGRYKELDDRLHEVEREVGGLPERWRSEIEKTRKELEGKTQDLVKRLADRNLRLRLLGVLYVVIGLTFSWLGNVI
jgi:hypothetical protein